MLNDGQRMKIRLNQITAEKLSFIYLAFKKTIRCNYHEVRQCIHSFTQYPIG
jgi:hypothetical protein